MSSRKGECQTLCRLKIRWASLPAPLKQAVSMSFVLVLARKSASACMLRISAQTLNCLWPGWAHQQTKTLSRGVLEGFTGLLGFRRLHRTPSIPAALPGSAPEGPGEVLELLQRSNPSSCGPLGPRQILADPIPGPP